MNRSQALVHPIAHFSSLPARALLRRAALAARRALLITARIAARASEALTRRSARDARDRDRLPDSFAQMNVWMLKDVGAPSWLLDRAIEELQQRRRIDHLGRF